MNKEVFYKEMKESFEKNKIIITDDQIEKFYLYMKELLEWNEKINLTAITDEKEIILKHFVDSVTIVNEIKSNSKLIDVGTGAGFPGIPIAIMREDVTITLLDSLNKRIMFLDNIKEKLNLKNIITIHGRAEDIGQESTYREKYDLVTSRAVAPLNILAEYMIPLAKINGTCICMKGSNIEEVNESTKAVKELGGQIENINKIKLIDTDIERNIIIIKKIRNTPKRYPRKAGTPKKSPIM